VSGGLGSLGTGVASSIFNGRGREEKLLKSASRKKYRARPTGVDGQESGRNETCAKTQGMYETEYRGGLFGVSRGFWPKGAGTPESRTRGRKGETEFSLWTCGGVWTPTGDLSIPKTWGVGGVGLGTKESGPTPR